MKRREFLRSAGAAAAIPALPLPAMAAPTAIAPVPAAQVGWAALFARVNDQTTPALLQKWMGVGPQQANALMSELVKRNIIHTPVAGTAMSVQPMFARGVVPGITKPSVQIWKRTRDTLKALVDDDADVDVNSQDCSNAAPLKAGPQTSSQQRLEPIDQGSSSE